MHESALAKGCRSQLALEEFTELIVVGRHNELASTTDCAKKVHEAENVVVVHVLNRIVQEDPAESVRRPEEVEGEKDANCDSVHLSAAEEHARVARGVALCGSVIDLTALVKRFDPYVKAVKQRVGI